MKDIIKKIVKESIGKENQIEKIKNIPIPSTIEGRFLNKQQAQDLQKEIEANYTDNILQHFKKEKNDIRMNMFNYDQPIAEKNLNGINLRITTGLIRNKKITYLLYANGKIIGEFFSVNDIKMIVKYIEDRLIKNISPIQETATKTKVICDNCGWKWNLKDGGNDPYVCHKCGHNNNPKSLDEKCWKGYTQKGMKTMFGKRYPNCVKKIIKEELDEALQDELPDYMINAIKKNNPNVADVFLNTDVPQHTELIPNVKLEIIEPILRKGFIKEIEEHFIQSLLEQYYKTQIYKNLLKVSFTKILAKSLNVSPNAILGLTKSQSKETNMLKLLKVLYSKNFTLLQSKDNNFDNPIFSNNKSNLFTFIKTFNNAFPNEALDLNAIMNDRIFVGLREPIMNFEQNVKDLGKTKLYLYITDKAADILRMSVSNFYSSCQNMYTGGYNEKLLSNVFDKNSKIAYLIFDSSYVDNQGNKHPFTPIARTIIRVGENNQILFDKTYPSQMEEDFYKILEKYTQLRNQGTRGSRYPYEHIGLPAPYMDKYKMKTIGGSDLEDNPRAVALADELDLDIDELEQESDTTFTYGALRYVVYTEDEADEYARDYMRDSWTEYFGDSANFYDLVISGVLVEKEVYKILNITDDYLNEIDMNFEEYLEEIGIGSLWDFNGYLGKKGINSWNWYTEDVTFNLDRAIRYLGGMGDARNFALASYDGREYYNDGYLIYRTD